MKVTISAEAEADLEAIAHFIAADSPLRAATFVEELVTSCHKLTDHPNRYPVVAHGAGRVRRLPYRGYSIYYAQTGPDIVVLHILNDAMDHGRILRDRD